MGNYYVIIWTQSCIFSTKSHGHLSSGQTSSLQWEVADSATDVPPTLPPFTKTHGPQTTLGAEASPIDFFSLFFDDSVLDLLVEETNRLVENNITVQLQKFTYMCTHIHTAMPMRESKPCCAWIGYPLIAASENGKL